MIFTLRAICRGLNYAWLSQEFPVLMICAPAVTVGLGFFDLIKVLASGCTPGVRLLDAHAHVMTASLATAG